MKKKRNTNYVFENFVIQSGKNKEYFQPTKEKKSNFESFFFHNQ